MKFIGNILWLLFGGLLMALGYFIASLLLMITIIGIPFGIQTMKFGILALWPFGHTVTDTGNSAGCLTIVMNVLWILLGGIEIALGHVVLGIILSITIIGIPFGKQHFKMGLLSLTPFGKTIE